MITEERKSAIQAKIDALTSEMQSAEESRDYYRAAYLCNEITKLRREIAGEKMRGVVLTHPAPPRMPHRVSTPPPPRECAPPLLALRLARFPAPNPMLVGQLLDLGVVALHGLRPGGA